MPTKSSQHPASTLQESLFIESFESAVYAIAARVGGMKDLALSLWPTKKDAAERWLSDCLNPDRAAKLSVDEIREIARIGREAGVHTLMYWFADETGYTRPSPVTLDDRIEETNRQVVQATAVLERAVTLLRDLTNQKLGPAK